MTLTPAPEGNLEARLDAMGRALESRSPGAAPAGFISAVRTRRRRVVAGRVGAGIGIAAVLAVVAVFAQMSARTTTTEGTIAKSHGVAPPTRIEQGPEDVTPSLASAPGAPAIGDARRFLSGSGIEMLPASSHASSSSPQVRIGDRTGSDTLRALLRND